MSPQKKTSRLKTKPHSKTSEALETSVEVSTPEPLKPQLTKSHAAKPQPPKRFPWLKIILIVVFSAILLIIAVAGVFALTINQYVKKFEATAGISRTELMQEVRAGLNQTPTQTNGKKNILLLGLDSLANREGDPEFTDTIMLLSLDLETGKLSAVSLPRDIWHPELVTKINALYHYGQERYPEQPEKFPTEVLSAWTGVPIHHTIVLTLDQVAELIDLVGGVEVVITEGFIDEKFPRSDVDIRTETDPDKLYETVMFTAGSEVMSGQRALKYIRSRKSVNQIQGTDEARAARQQQIIAAVLQKISDPAIIKQPSKLGKFFAFYRTSFEKSISLSELVATGYQLRDDIKEIQFEPTTVSIQTSDQDGVLIHPPVEKYNQWVYEVPDVARFQTEIKGKLRIE